MPYPFQCAGTFNVLGREWGFLKSVACRGALDDANKRCSNELCQACCEVLDCECSCAGLAVDFFCACVRFGDRCINVIGCHDGPGGYKVSDGSPYTATILPPGPTQTFATPIYFIREGEEPLSLGINIFSIGQTTDLGVIPAGQRLQFAVWAAGTNPECGFPFVHSSPAFENADNMIHAIMHCETSRVAFEQICFGGDLDYDDAIFKVEKRPQ